MKKEASILSAIMNTMHEGVLVVDHVSKEIIDYNSKFLSMWKIEIPPGEKIHDEQLLGQVIQQIVDPDTFLKQVTEIYQKPDLSFLDTVELKGSVFFERRSEPLVINAEVRGRIFFFRDVTEERIARENISTQKNLLETIISTIPHAVFWKDRDLRYLGCNEIFYKDAGRQSTEEMISKCDYDMPWSSNAEHYRFCDRQVMLSGAAQTNLEETLIKGDGTEITLLTSKVPLRDGQQNVIGILGIYTDITEFKNNQKLLKEKESLLVNVSQMSSLGEMAAGIAHEINNPLSIIRISMDYLKNLLRKSNDSNAEIDTVIQEVNQTVDRIARIIQGMRNISRVSKGNKEKFTLSEMLTDVLSVANDRFKTQGIKVQNEVSDALSQKTLLADRIQISQVLINILNNALDAVTQLDMDDKWIEIKLEQTSEMWVLMITDCGNGIPSSIQEKMFNPFYTTKEIGKGTGIGLSISKAMIEKNGGQLLYDETCKNTRFIIQLPKASD